MPAYDIMFQADCCKQSKDKMNTDSAESLTSSAVTVPQPRCHCPPCLNRAENHLNAAVKTVGTLGLVFSLTEVFVNSVYILATTPLCNLAHVQFPAYQIGVIVWYII